MPLSAPVTAVAMETSAGRLGRAAVVSMHGIRNSFEDAHCIDQEHGFCAVYDGHLGDEAAAFCAERLHLHLKAQGEPSKDALLAAFQACDAELKSNLPEGSEAGTTATVAIVREGNNDALKVLVANCGDSRTVLWRRADSVLEFTADHRPSDPGERARVEAAGGTVWEDFDPPRIDGQLACSRALGAFKYKADEAKPAEKQKVSSVPDIYEWEAKRGDLLILACDGVWDELSNQQVVDDVCKASEGDLKAALTKVLELCIKKDAEDNMTLMAMELGSVKQEEKVIEVTAGNFLKTKDKEVLDQYTGFCLRFGFELSKEMVPKGAPVAKISPATAMPGLQYAGLPAPTGAGLEVEAVPMVLDPLVVVGPLGEEMRTLIKGLLANFRDRFSHVASEAAAEAEDSNISSGIDQSAVDAIRDDGKICVLVRNVSTAKQIKKDSEDHSKKFLFIASSREEGSQQEAGLFDCVLATSTNTAVAGRELCDAVRNLYPGLTLRMKVTAKRSPAFYTSAAKAMIAGRGSTSELEVRGLGNAVPIVVAVIAALEADGHEVVLTETTFVEVMSDAAQQKVQTPQLRLVLRLVDSSSS